LSQPAQIPDIAAVLPNGEETAAEDPATEQKLQLANTSNQTASTSYNPVEPSAETAVPAAVEAPAPVVISNTVCCRATCHFKTYTSKTSSSQQAVQINTSIVDENLTHTQGLLTIPEYQLHKTLGDRDEKQFEAPTTKQ